MQRQMRSLCYRKPKHILILLAVLASLALLRNYSSIESNTLPEPTIVVDRSGNFGGDAVEVKADKRERAIAIGVEDPATAARIDSVDAAHTVAAGPANSLAHEPKSLNASTNAAEADVAVARHADPVEANQNDATKPTAEGGLPSVPIKLGTPCPVQQTCSDPDRPYSYYIQSGMKIDIAPVICFNNELVVGEKVEPQRWGRGANVVVIHPDLKKVVDTRVFDLYDSVDNCLDMTVYLSTQLSWKSVILIASMDDMSLSLCKPLTTILSQFGSSLINQVKFRDNFVLIGEKGLPGNLGIEQLIPKGEGDWPSHPANVSGCTSMPISTKYVSVSTDLGLELEGCGVPRCGFDEIELHIQTHQTNVNLPKLCLGNKYYLFPGVAGGRGFNILVLDPQTRNVKQILNFDTYKTESSRLELFLESVDKDDFLIVVISDDASFSLKETTKTLLKQFGFDASQIAMRTVGYFVGQKGLHVSSFQKVAHPANPQAWPSPIKERFCLPLELPKGSPTENAGRTEFCAHHDGFADFCFVHHKREALSVVESSVDTKAIADVYNVPILVLAGVNNIALSRTLQSILKQPGISPAMVHVAYSKMFGEDYPAFIKLFKFSEIALPPVSKYSDFINAAFKELWAKNPSAEYVIVIDDEIVTYQGFIWYMGHALQALKKHESIAAASAFNPQGFWSVARDPSSVHLVDQFPGLAFLMKKSFYTQEIQDKEAKCCFKRSVLQWFAEGTSEPHTYIVPEVSRASYFSTTAYATQLDPLPKMTFARNRTVESSDMHGITLNMDMVDNFEAVLTSELSGAHFLEEAFVGICAKETDVGSKIVSFLPDNKNIAIVYKQSETNDYSTLEKLYPCLGLMYMEGHKPHGMHEGITSVTLSGRKAYLIGTSSRYHSLVEKYNPHVITL